MSHSPESQKNWIESFSIQKWLTRIPGRTLKDTDFGVKNPEDNTPRDEIFTDPLLSQVYKMDIANFLIAEKHSYINTAKMLPLAPDEDSQIFLATQVLDEARHYEVFSKRLEDAGVDEEQKKALMERYNTPQMQKLFDAMEEQLDKGNFLGSVIGQNFILEGMAYPLYRYEMKYWSLLDPGLSQIIRGAFADEVNHTSFGEDFLRLSLSQNQTQKNQVQRLIREFHLIMNEIFETIIKKTIGIYQMAIDPYLSQLGEIELFPGKLMGNILEKEQVEILLGEIEGEFSKSMNAIGLTV